MNCQLNTSFPQLAETETPWMRDASGEYWLYYGYMTLVYVADVLTGERSAVHVMLLDLSMKVAGEAHDTATAQVIGVISQPAACQQAAISSGADAFISKEETPERVGSAAASVRS
jgi:hypothetical protein